MDTENDRNIDVVMDNIDITLDCFRLLCKELRSKFVFKGFREYTPKVVYKYSYLFLCFGMYDIEIETMIEIQKTKGYIEPKDFKDNYLKPY
jgi:hypothetical protein